MQAQKNPYRYSVTNSNVRRKRSRLTVAKVTNQDRRAIIRIELRPYLVSLGSTLRLLDRVIATTPGADYSWGLAAERRSAGKRTSLGG